MVCFAEALEVNNFTLPKKANDIVDVWVIGQAEDIVIGDTGFLLCGQVFGEVGNNIPSDLHGGSRPGIARGELGIYSCGMIHEISVKPGGFDLVIAQIVGELMDQSAHHFQVPKLFCTYQRTKKLQQKIGKFQ